MSEKAKVTNQIVSYIKAHILNGSWALGDKLPSESQLCNQFQCSRVTVRSALQRFIAIGAIQSVRGKGSYLIATNLDALEQTSDTISFHHLIDLMDFAVLVWPQICVQAALENRSGLLQTLQNTVDKMRALTPSQTQALWPLVDAFHSSIATSLNNRTLQDTFSAVLSQLVRYPCSENVSTCYYGTVYYHDLLLSAMQRGDAERIQSVVRDYLTHAKLNFYQLPSDLERGRGSEQSAQ